MKTLAIIATLLLATALPASGAGTATDPVAKTDGPAPPIVYFSFAPNYCLFTESSMEYWIFVHSPDDNNFERVTFDLDMSGTWTTPPAVAAEPGVMVGTADVSTSTWHFDFLWSWRTLEHTPMLRIIFFEEPQWAGGQSPSNVVFARNGGAQVPSWGLTTFGGGPIDCFPCGLEFLIDDPITVPVNVATEIDFSYFWACWAWSSGPLTVTDTEGWVSSWAPDRWSADGTCGLCYLPEYPGTIAVNIPEGVAPGTTSEMTISTVWGPDTFHQTVTLEAIAPVPVETSTWGAVKALFD